MKSRIPPQWVTKSRKLCPHKALSPTSENCFGIGLLLSKTPKISQALVKIYFDNQANNAIVHSKFPYRNINLLILLIAHLLNLNSLNHRLEIEIRNQNLVMLKKPCQLKDFQPGHYKLNF